MKKSILLLITTLIACIIFSQQPSSDTTLTPIVQKVGDSTIFCFNVNQAKDIAKRIEELNYCDTLLNTLSKLYITEELAGAKRDSIIKKQKLQLYNFDKSSYNYREVIHENNKTISKQSLCIKKLKKQRNYIGVIAAITTTIILIK